MRQTIDLGDVFLYHVSKNSPEVNSNPEMKNHLVRNVKNPDFPNHGASNAYVDTKSEF